MTKNLLFNGCKFFIHLSINLIIFLLIVILLSSSSFIECRSSSSFSPWRDSDYGNNNIIQGDVNNITCPTQCQCSFNPSKWINETFRVVDCSSKGLKRLSRNSIPKHTQSLWLTGNRLDLYSFVSINHHQDHLIELDLSNNSITTLGRSSAHPFLSLVHLRYLNLSSNGFKTLYSGIFRGLKRLERLDINSGQLKYIDEHAFDGLENLVELNLKDNKISSIFLELFQSIVNLHVLNLDGNSIDHLPGGIFASLNNLRQLNLDRNNLRVIDDNSLVGLDMLETINLCHNQLTKVPSIALQSLKRIKHINLSGNRLVTLTTGDFVHLPVQSISISFCQQLTFIERMAFWDLPDLIQLDLTSNKQLKFIDSQSFLGTPRLNRLQLDNNSLSIIEGEMINNIIDHHRLTSLSTTKTTTTMVNQVHHHHINHANLNHNHYHHQTSQQPNHHHQHQHHQLIISLSSNPLLCDCNIHYLYQCLNPVNRSKVLILDGDKLTCTHQPVNESMASIPILVKELDIKSIPTECIPTIISMEKLFENSFNRSMNETMINNQIFINGSIGDKINLNCRAIGVPMPTITWILPSGIVFNETINTFHMQLIKLTNQLRINHLRTSDSGQYKCIAENDKGSVELIYNLIVEDIKVQIWPLGVSSTFVSVIWNGTNTINHHQFHPRILASSSLSSTPTSVTSPPEYQILYKREDDPSDRFESISVGHYLRSYTIKHLLPRKRYKLCIAVRDSESHGNYVQLSCTLVTTSSDSSLSSPFSSISSSDQSSSFLHDSISDTSSYLAIALILTLTALAIVILAFTVLGARRAFIVVNRHSQQFTSQQQFETPKKSLVHNMAPIPLTHIPFDQEI